MGCRETEDAEGLAKQLDLHVDHIRDGPDARRSDSTDPAQERPFFAAPKTTPVRKNTDVGGKTVHSVLAGALFICLERKLTLEQDSARWLEKKPERVGRLDEGFAGNDRSRPTPSSLKTRASPASDGLRHRHMKIIWTPTSSLQLEPFRPLPTSSTRSQRVRRSMAVIKMGPVRAGSPAAADRLGCRQSVAGGEGQT